VYESWIFSAVWCGVKRKKNIRRKKKKRTHERGKEGEERMTEAEEPARKDG